MTRGIPEYPVTGIPRDFIRGGDFPSRELRALAAPQKCHCMKCNHRWLAWPRLYCGDVAFPKTLRRLRSLIGGRGEWGPP